MTRDEIADALTFHPAFELAGSRYAPGTGNRAATTFDGIADNGSGGAAVLGAAVANWQTLPFDTMEIDARIDDSPPIQIYTGAYRRDPARDHRRDLLGPARARRRRFRPAPACSPARSRCRPRCARGRP